MDAWVTLVTNDSYSMGALTLAASLRRVNTAKKMVVMVTTGITSSVMAALNEAFDEVVSVEALDSGDMANLALLDRRELGITFTKIRCWTLTQYTKAVFLDADTLVLQNSDELFDREEFSAAPDAGWPDCFNSGVFVFRPNLNTYKELVQHAVTQGSFDGGDQGLLNTFFSSWAHKDISKHLPFTYNMVASASYSYLPAFKEFGQKVKIIHFIGATKPWQVDFDNSTGEAKMGSTEQHTRHHLRLWWQLFSTQVRPSLAKLQQPVSSNCGAVSSLTCMGDMQRAPEYQNAPPPPVEDNRLSMSDNCQLRAAWDQGRPDYSGTASFDNILNKIEKTMSK